MDREPIMNFRFSLDAQIDAQLIAHIQEISNGGSPNKAMKLFVQNQFAIYIDRKLTPHRQESVIAPSKENETTSEPVINLSSLDSIFSDIGE